MLNQLKQLEQAAKTGVQQPIDEKGGFSNVLTNALENINEHQMQAGELAKKIEMGDGGVSLVKAMIASQKASVAFEAAVQVRNRVVSAYQDIMNMPI